MTVQVHQEEQNRHELNKMVSDFEQRLRRSQLAEQVPSIAAAELPFEDPRTHPLNARIHILRLKPVH